MVKVGLNMAVNIPIVLLTIMVSISAFLSISEPVWDPKTLIITISSGLEGTKNPQIMLDKPSVNT